MRTCKKCGEDKDEQEFNDTSAGRKRSDCKECQKQYRRFYYYLHKEEEMRNQSLRRMQLKRFRR